MSAVMGDKLCKNCGARLHIANRSGYCTRKECKRIREAEAYHNLKAMGICPSCRERPIATGLSYCQECTDRKNRWAVDNRRSDIALTLWRFAKNRAKAKGIEFTIEPEDITVPEVCPVLGIPLIFGGPKVKGVKIDNAPSIDRLDNSKGYVKGNVLVISWKANNIKRNYGSADLLKVGKWLRKLGY